MPHKIRITPESISNIIQGKTMMSIKVSTIIRTRQMLKPQIKRECNTKIHKNRNNRYLNLPTQPALLRFFHNEKH